MSNAIATTILQQLGGSRFAAMTGARDFVAIDRGLRMRLPRNMSKANYLCITLATDDTYTMRFYRYTMGRLRKDYTWTPDKLTEVRLVDGVYWDALRRIFTETTGMDTTL